jgi:hypothetical protein
MALIFVVNIADMLTDHWNFRGIISEVGFQLMYWMELDTLLYMYILTQWLWYDIQKMRDYIGDQCFLNVWATEETLISFLPSLASSLRVLNYLQV